MNPNSRVQAYGRDAKNRLQIIYHEKEVTLRQKRKESDMLRMTQNIDHILSKVQKDAEKGHPSALMAWIIFETCARPGHEKYREQNGTFGAANLRCGHLENTPDAVRIVFRAKHGKTYEGWVREPSIVRALSARRAKCRNADEPFWADDDADTLNVYLESVCKGLRAKHLRTWAANIWFLRAWLDALDAKPDARVRAAVRTVATRLQNTPAVARKQYILRVVEDGVMTKGDLVQKWMKKGPVEALHGLLSAG